MTHFMRYGETFRVASDKALDLYDVLPAGTYTVGYDEMAGEFYLKAVEDLTISGKLYGNTSSNADRILKTFELREGSTGVLLMGEKGSGKTLLAKKVSVDARTQGIPTIVINQPWKGEGFNKFIQTISQPAIVIFDEFEKVYDRDDQEKMLTLLDGVYTSKKLFVLTANDSYKIDRHMLNRPGRLFYRFDYAGLEADFIREYCEDNLSNKSHIEDVVRVSLAFSDFNFDILKAIVEEMNRYGETATQVLKFVNASPENSTGRQYSVRLDIDDVPVEERFLDDKKIILNPLSQPFSVDYQIDSSDSDDDGDSLVSALRYQSASFSPSDIIKLDTGTGSVILKNDKGARVILKPIKQEAFNYNLY